MPPQPEAIWTLVRAVKDAVIDGFVSEGVDLPDRRVITPGLPAWDCEGLYVQAVGTFGVAGSPQLSALEAQYARPSHALRAVRVAITILRCVPTLDDDGNPPTVANEEAAAEIVLTDAVLLLNVLVAAQRSGDLPECSSVAFEDWENVGPEGGLAGGTLRVLLGVGV